MPEGHTLHRLALELDRTFGGKIVVASSPQGRFAAGALRLNGHRLLTADAYGKHLLLGFEDIEETLHVHLGLYGRLTLLEGSGHPVVGQVRLRLEDTTHTADLRGPTSCALFRPDEVEALLARLGPDPLRDDADASAAFWRISASKTAIATMLMNQEVIAGLGNIYRAELLFRHGLDPFLPGSAIDEGLWNELWKDIVGLMSEGVSRGQIDTVRPEHEPEVMGRAPRDDEHGGEVYVYRRAGQGCLICGTEIRMQTLACRNLFWCPECQQRR